MRKIEIGSIINRAKRRLGLQNTFEEDGYFELLAIESLRGTNATDVYTIQCATLDIDCGSAKLPDQYDQLLFFQFGDGTGCSGCCGANITPTAGENQIIVCTCRGLYGYFQQNNIILQHGQTCGWYGNYFQIQNGFINFPSTITATQITVYYKGFNEDDDGFMVFSEEQQRGLSAYIAWQYSTDKLNTGIYTPQQNQAWQREWIAQKGWLNGKEAIRSFKLNKQNIMLLANAVLSNKNYYLPSSC